MDLYTPPPSPPAPDLSVTLAGVHLPTPVVLLSGCIGFGEELFQLAGFDWSAVGALCLKGTTLAARQGNPPHRVAETPAGMLNAIGLQNPGARQVVELILPRLTARLAEAGAACRLIANIAGSTVEEYGETAAIFDHSAVDAIEINISCPNVKQGGAAFGADPAVAAQVVETVKRATRKPLITKLSPNVTDIRAVARAVLEAGTDAVSAINTLMGMAIDIHTRQALLGNFMGGLSGPAVKPVALYKVWQVYQETRPRGIPIIGQGGAANAQDAVEFLLAGASAVGIGTALFANPHAAAAMVEGLRAYLKQAGLPNPAALTGTLRAPGG